MFRRPSVLYLALGVGALLLGLMVYLFDRRPEHVYFLSHGFVLAHAPHSLFGIAGNSLPTFLHVYAFILLTAAVAGTAKSRLIRICAAWLVVAALFEFAQLQAVAPIIAAAVPAWFARVPILDNTAAYFLNGTFDVLDLLSIALGTVAAYLTVALTSKAVRTTFREDRHRTLRRGATAGVVVLGLFTIIASGGGGSSTPDTTPPTVSATYPADAATGVFVDSSIRITFSERMDPATVNPSTFTLEDNVNHTPVLTTVDYGGDTVTFTPTNLLSPSRAYTATITTAAKDLAGNALAANFIWSFTTETDAWQATATTIGVPTGRTKPTAVWTGSKMIVWGGQDSGGATSSGALYDPVADTWSTTTTTNAPAARLRHTAIWDDHDARMIVWGGQDSGGTPLGSGGLYTVADTWSQTQPSGAPTPRFDHTAVWTGTEMIVWGGNTSLGFSNTGAAYNPGTNSWRTLPSSGLLERAEHTAVWTGTEMIVWGGNTNLGPGNDGAAYNPTTNTWRSIANPPVGFLGRTNHTVVWTGTEMIVWGGSDGFNYFNDGAAYNPTTNTWRLISTTSAPTPRFNHTAVWTGPTGISMVVWGGQDGAGNLLHDGGRYDPVTDTWKATDVTGNEVPTERTDHTAVWTGTEMIVWGGNDGTLTATGGRYTP